MSLLAVLVPLAIALSATVKKSRYERSFSQTGRSVRIASAETFFTDRELLVKTLRDHGLPVEKISNDRIRVRSGGYELLYERAKAGDAFLVSAVADNGEELLFDLDCLEKEYMSNVQSDVYKKLIRKLSESDMTVESEEVTEDDAILLTINVP